jgi:hypothetical protein
VGARRSSVRGLPGSAAVPCCRINPARATTGATSAARPGETHWRSRSPGISSIGAAHAVPGVFAPLGCGPIRVDGGGPCRRDDGRIGPRRSVVSTAEAVSRCGQGGANARETRNNREGTMPLSSKAADRTCRVGPTARVVEPPLYTVEGRQTGDSRRKCDIALIRKAKLPSRLYGWLSLLAGTADKAH